MKLYKSNQFFKIYKKLLHDLLHNPEFICEPRGLKIHEILNVSIELTNPLNSLYYNKRRSSQEKYIAAETIWYFMGVNTTEFITKYASFWNQIKNPDDKTVNSAYGYCIFNDKIVNQYNWAINSLINDKDSRQAIMHFNKEEHQFKDNKDFVCTMYANFHIRNNKLYMSVKMRSNDLILGVPTDFAFFCILQQHVLNDLKQYYPELTLGSYVHQIDSLHLYERNFNLVKEMLENGFKQLKQWPKVTSNLIKSKEIESIYNSELKNTFIKKSKNKFINHVYKTLKDFNI